jgi:hypothetical protein
VEEVKIAIIILKRPNVKRNQDYLSRKSHLLKFLYTYWQEKWIFRERKMGLSYEESLVSPTRLFCILTSDLFSHAFKIIFIHNLYLPNYLCLLGFPTNIYCDTLHVHQSDEEAGICFRMVVCL